jgi:hypothetical protein
MTGKDALALEEDGYIEFNEQRGVYEEIDEEGIFMQTLPTDDDRHDSDAEEFRNESKRQDFDAMADAGMSLRDFISVD